MTTSTQVRTDRPSPPTAFTAPSDTSRPRTSRPRPGAKGAPRRTLGLDIDREAPPERVCVLDESSDAKVLDAPRFELCHVRLGGVNQLRGFPLRQAASFAQRNQ